MVFVKDLRKNLLNCGMVIYCSYVNTVENDEDSIGKLIKLYNGSKWRGRVLKFLIRFFNKL